jgi:xylulokinase
MHGLVILDGDHKVIRPSLIWCDQRSQAQVDAINRTVGSAKVLSYIANPVLTGFTLPKLLWVRDNEPEHYARVRKMLLPKDYVRFRLTGEFATEVSDASGTALFDVIKREWSSSMIAALSLDRAILPECHESIAVSGAVTPAIATLTGLAAGTPVVGGGGDQAASAVGNGIVELGIVSCTLGTSGVVFAHMEQVAYDPSGRVHTFCHAVPDKWHVMGVTQGAGLTPHLDATARGGWIGLTAKHTRADLIRSVIEGVSYSQKDCLDIIEQLGVLVRSVRVSGGGGKSPFWRQVLADVLEKPVVTLETQEGSAYGAALLALVGTGAYSSVPEVCRSVIRETGSIQPRTEESTMYRDGHSIYRSLYPALKPISQRIARL